MELKDIDKNALDFFKLIGKGVVTLIILCPCMYVFFWSDFGDTEKKFAAGLIGTIVGYWIR